MDRKKGKRVNLNGIFQQHLCSNSYSLLQNISKQVCTLLRAIAGNDDVKTSIVDAGGLGLIVAAMTTHAKQPTVAEQGCAALGSIALRSPPNCSAIVAAGGVEAIVKAMQIHPDVAGVQVKVFISIYKK